MEISVVMACHNSNRVYLNQAVESVLNQTFSNFELNIIDDGSNRTIKSIIESKDKRLNIYRLEKKFGLGAALNFGVAKSKGKYIARIDDDDLMKSNRLELQYSFMEEHPASVCVGTQINMLYKNKAIKYRKYPANNEAIIKDLIKIKFSLAHSSVMFSKEAFNKIGGYRIKGGGQDLDLFLQLSKIGQLNNLDQYITYYRLSKSGLSVNNPEKKEAYIFALEHFQNDRYIEEIQQSMLKLKKSKNTFSIKGYCKRRILILFVKLFGCKTLADKGPKSD